MQTLKRLITAGLIATLSLGLFGPTSKAEHGIPEFVQVETGEGTTAAVRPDGSLWMWGDQYLFGLDPDPNSTATFTKRAGSSSDWAQVALGSFHAVGIKKDGTLWGWGYNDAGQVGNGQIDANTVRVPQQIAGGRHFRSVSAKFSHNVAIAEDGSLWTWGDNFVGTIGDGTREHRPAPVQIGDDTDWVKAVAGLSHMVAFKSDGSMWAWGAQWHGRLGDGVNTEERDAIQLTPKRIGTFDFTSVSVGDDHTLALKADGSLWAWGHNIRGAIGDGTYEPRPIPTQIGSDQWRQVHAIGFSSVGIKTDGTLWMWGDLQPGKPNPTLPLQVGTDRDWASISGGGSGYDEHVILVKQDGSLWGFGSGGQGQLGNDRKAWYRGEPVKFLISRTLADVVGTTGKPTLDQVSGALEPLKDYISLHFDDVDREAWYAPALAKLVGLRVMGGYPDGTLRPDGTVAVDQFIKMLLSARGAELPNGSPYWASTWIDQAIASGFIRKGQFDRYDRPITRAEMAQVIAAVLKAEASVAIPPDLKARIADFSAIRPADQPAVLDVYARGILTGRPDETFQSGGTLSRAEAAVVILRVIDPGERLPLN